MATTYQLLTLCAWLAIMSSTSGKPVKQDGSITSLLGDNISLDIQEKAEAIDNLLRLLSEINLPSICDALAAKKNSVNQNVKSVDAILAQAARSQAMTFIPTNLPETRDVTRPGTISDLIRICPEIADC